MRVTSTHRTRPRGHTVQEDVMLFDMDGGVNRLTTVPQWECSCRAAVQAANLGPRNAPVALASGTPGVAVAALMATVAYR